MRYNLIHRAGMVLQHHRASISLCMQYKGLFRRPWLTRRQVPPVSRNMLVCTAAYAGQAVPEEITSLQNALVKHCVKVRQKASYREESGTVVLSGADLVTEVAAHAAIKVLFVVQGAPVPDVPARRVVCVPPPVMQKITGLESVSQSTLAAEVELPSEADFAAGWRPGQLRRLLVLERLQDPGNLGTLLRTAVALGWHAALLLPGCCDPYNEKALRAGRGAAFKLPLASGTLQDLRRIAGAHQLVCLAGEPHAAPSGGSSKAKSAAAPAQQAQQPTEEQGGGPDEEWEGWLWGEQAGGNGGGGGGSNGGEPRQQGRQGVCLVLGSEGQGLSDEVLQMSVPVAVPMQGDMESLNVAAAGAILMFSLSEGAAQLQATVQGALLPPDNGAAKGKQQQQLGRQKAAGAGQQQARRQQQRAGKGRAGAM